MDTKHPVLSHQAHLANSLGERFSKVLVVTGRHDSKTVSAPNVEIFDTRWVEGQNIRNILRFYSKVYECFRKSNEIEVVFSHMSVIQSVLISPLLVVKRIPHILWYAHKSSSFSLRIASYVVQRILTSTPGSCPIKGDKIQAIGQGIDTEQFKPITNRPRRFLNMVHIGRADKSKKLDLLISEAQRIRDTSGENITLTLIGNSSNEEELLWFQGIKTQASQANQSGWLNFQEGVNRLEIPSILSAADIFVHAFIGSLDKTLIEATLCKVPILTLNPEYLKIFGSWGKSDPVTILSEYQALRSLSVPEIEFEIERRFQIAFSGHSYRRWVDLITEAIDSMNP
jgi:glycosyltransferase involved in cell wall biosynthesis